MKLFLIAILFFLLGCGAGFGVWGRSFLLRKHKLQDLERSFELQCRQLEEQNRRLAQLTQLRHDLHHHAVALQGLAQSGDLRAVGEYLDGFSSLRLDAPVRMCANPAVDALAHQYLGAARDDGIAVDAALEIGEDVGIQTPDLCVVFGNCLENAVEAARQTEAGFIRIRTKDAPGWLSIVMENSCPQGSLRTAERGYFSTKERDRIGVGLVSIRAISEKYGGTATYEMADGRFRTAVILFKKDETT